MNIADSELVDHLFTKNIIEIDLGDSDGPGFFITWKFSHAKPGLTDRSARLGFFIRVRLLRRRIRRYPGWKEIL
jgi:hypothetical protein